MLSENGPATPSRLVTALGRHEGRNASARHTRGRFITGARRRKRLVRLACFGTTGRRRRTTRASVRVRSLETQCSALRRRARVRSASARRRQRLHPQAASTCSTRQALVLRPRLRPLRPPPSASERLRARRLRPASLAVSAAQRPRSSRLRPPSLARPQPIQRRSSACSVHPLGVGCLAPHSLWRHSLPGGSPRALAPQSRTPRSGRTSRTRRNNSCWPWSACPRGNAARAMHRSRFTRVSRQLLHQNRASVAQLSAKERTKAPQVPHAQAHAATGGFTAVP